MGSMRRVQDAHGFLLIRAKAGMHPQVIEAVREDGTRLRSLRNTPLQALHAKLPKRQRVELLVRWQGDGQPLCLRLIVSWHCYHTTFCSLLTNLPAPRSTLEMICRAYKWRWPVEISQSCTLRRTLFWQKFASVHLKTARRALGGGEAWRPTPLRWPPMRGHTTCLTAIPT